MKIRDVKATCLLTWISQRTCHGGISGYSEQDQKVFVAQNLQLSFRSAAPEGKSS